MVIILHSLNLFQREYIYCTKRLVDTFYNEFLNWSAIFEAVQNQILDETFINELFEVFRIVVKRIKDNADSEELLRSYIHAAIQYLNEFERQRATSESEERRLAIAAPCGRIIASIINADKYLKLISIVSPMYLYFFQIDVYDLIDDELNNAVIINHIRLIVKFWIEFFEMCVNNDILNHFHNKQMPFML